MLQNVPLRGLPHAQLECCAFPTLAGLLSLDAEGNGSFSQWVICGMVDDTARELIACCCDGRLRRAKRGGRGFEGRVSSGLDINAKVDFLGGGCEREVVGDD